MNTKKVSVIMPVYNGDKFLREAIDSILLQTYSNFEFIIINDSSTDKSLEIIKSYNDKRIILLTNEKNLGLASSLNRGIEKSTGYYIARMDSDDISFPTRLEEQVDFMEKNPEISLSGTWAKTIGSKTGYIKHPTDPEEIKVSLLFRTSLVHPTIIIRRDFLISNNIKYQNPEGSVTYSDDYDLYSRVSPIGTIANIGKVLLYYRLHNKQVSVEYKEIQIDHSKKIIERQLQRLGITPSEDELQTMVSIKRYLFLNDLTFQNKTEKILLKIKSANNIAKIYDKKALEKILGNIWLDIALAYRSQKINKWKTFWSSQPRKWLQLNIKNIYRITKLFISNFYL